MHIREIQGMFVSAGEIQIENHSSLSLYSKYNFVKGKATLSFRTHIVASTALGII